MSGHTGPLAFRHTDTGEASTRLLNDLRQLLGLWDPGAQLRFYICSLFPVTSVAGFSKCFQALSLLKSFCCRAQTSAAATIITDFQGLSSGPG